MRPSDVERFLVEQIDPERDWTEVSVFSLLHQLIRHRTAVLLAIDSLLRKYDGLVEPVATTPAMATLGNRGRSWYLRRYYHHRDGRLISHLSLHRDILKQAA